MATLTPLSRMPYNQQQMQKCENKYPRENLLSKSKFEVFFLYESFAKIILNNFIDKQHNVLYIIVLQKLYVFKS